MRRRGKACHWSMRRERGSVVGHWTGRIEAIAPSLFQAGSWSLLFTRFSAERKGRRSWDFANMMVGGSYRSCPNFTAGNDVEPGMFCGQAAARGATYRLRRVWGVTDIFQICRVGLPPIQKKWSILVEDLKWLVCPYILADPIPDHTEPSNKRVGPYIWMS